MQSCFGIGWFWNLVYVQVQVGMFADEWDNEQPAYSSNWMQANSPWPLFLLPVLDSPIGNQVVQVWN